MQVGRGGRCMGVSVVTLKKMLLLALFNVFCFSIFQLLLCVIGAHYAIISQNTSITLKLKSTFNVHV